MIQEQKKVLVMNNNASVFFKHVELFNIKHLNITVNIFNISVSNSVVFELC